MTAMTARLEAQAPFARARSDIYVLLGALLTRSSSSDVLQGLRELEMEAGLPHRLRATLMMLREAGRSYSPTEVELEFWELFVGLGGGAIVPYASWYRERLLMSRPLADLRRDLCGLGLCRRQEAIEPEDHAGVLCEILAMISRAGSGVSLTQQRSFFEAHVLPWLPLFFMDLQDLRSAAFFRHVGVLGGVFLEAEKQYLIWLN